MPMLPKRMKFRKQQRGRLRGNATRGNYVAYGDFGLQALQPKWLTARQIEAGRIAAQHFLRRQGKIYIRIFPDKPISKKPLEVCWGTSVLRFSTLEDRSHFIFPLICSFARISACETEPQVGGAGGRGEAFR